MYCDITFKSNFFPTLIATFFYLGENKKNSQKNGEKNGKNRGRDSKESGKKKKKTPNRSTTVPTITTSMIT